jgi:hypothetical protein
MNAEEQLTESFSRIGREYGYDKVTAEFMAYKEFKVKWQRSYKWADFKVSDYIMDADKDVLDALASTLFSKIAGDEREYPQELYGYVTNPEFSKFKQPIYLRRSRNIARTSEGDTRNLEESVDRLEEMGLVKRDPSIYLTWTKEPNVRKVGYCSVLMKVIVISKTFDTEMIPDFVLDYVVYHEYVHHIIGFDPLGRKHGQNFQELEDRFTRKDEAESWLRRLCLYL